MSLVGLLMQSGAGLNEIFSLLNKPTSQPKGVSYPRNITDESFVELLGRPKVRSRAMQYEDFEPVAPLEKYGDRYQ